MRLLSSPTRERSSSFTHRVPRANFFYKRMERLSPLFKMTNFHSQVAVYSTSEKLPYKQSIIIFYRTYLLRNSQPKKKTQIQFRRGTPRKKLSFSGNEAFKFFRVKLIASSLNSSLHLIIRRRQITKLGVYTQA